MAVGVIQANDVISQGQAVLVEGLCHAHPVSQTATAVIGSSSAGDASIHGYGSNVPLGCVIVSWYPRVIQKCGDAVEVLFDPIAETQYVWMFPATSSSHHYVQLVARMFLFRA